MARMTPTSKRDATEKINAFISEGVQHCPNKHLRCEENGRYVRGEQWSEGDLERQKHRERPSIAINDTFKAVHAIANREMVERLVPKALGRSREDAGAAQVLDEGARWQRQMSGSEHYESMSFRSATIGGYGCMHKFWNPVSLGGDGQIVDEDVPIWEMLWPIRAREMGMSDRRWHLRGKWYDLDVIDNLWGEDSRAVKQRVKDWKVTAANRTAGPRERMPDPLPGRDGTGGQAGTWLGVHAGQWFNTATKEACVVEAEWKETERFYRAAVPARMAEWVSFINGGAPLTIDGPDGQAIQLTIEQFGQIDPQMRQSIEYMILNDVEIARFDTKAELDEVTTLYQDVFGREFPDDQWLRDSREIVMYAIKMDDLIIDMGKRPWGFSYYFITGFPFESRTGMDFYGAVDIIKGPQDLKNGLISNLLAQYMASPKGAIIIEKGAMPNIQEFMDKYASTGGVIEAPDGFLQSQKFLRLDNPSFPQFPQGLMAIADAGVQGGLGIDPISLNAQSDLRRISGNVVQAARTASNVVVAILFDSLRKFRKEYGLCNLRFLAHMYSPNEMIRIVGEEKLEDLKTMPEDWGEVLKYDIVIDEQPVTPTEQLELLDFLTRTGELSQMRQRGDIDLEEQLEFMPQLPESKKRLILSGKTKRDQLAQLGEKLQQYAGSLDKMISIVEQKAKLDPTALEILAEFEASIMGQDTRAVAAGGQPSGIMPTPGQPQPQGMPQVM